MGTGTFRTPRGSFRAFDSSAGPAVPVALVLLILSRLSVVLSLSCAIGVCKVLVLQWINALTDQTTNAATCCILELSVL